MKKLLLALVTSLVLATPSFALAQEGGMSDFDIKKYVAHIDVKTDGTFRVHESIDVLFHTNRHGIFRNIPVHYKNDSGNGLSIGVDVVDVRANSSSATYTTSRSGDDLIIKIGDADRYVSGKVVYEITYDVSRALLFTDTTDELYWNVTGTEWPVTPLDVEAIVRLPSAIDAAKVEDSCYTGSYGSQFSNCDKLVTKTVSGSSVTFTAHDFLTVAVRFPSGAIARPTVWQRIGWFIGDNKVVALPLILFLLLFAYWWRNGRDPKPRAIVVEFAAPKDLTPAEVGALEDSKVHDRELSATIVDLAIRGYVKIIDTENKGTFGSKHSFALERTEKPLDDLRPHEKLLFDAVMGDAKRRELSDMLSRAKDVQTKRKAAETLIYQEMAAKKWFVSNPETVRNFFIAVAVVTGVIAIWFVSGISTAWMFSLIASAVVIGVFGLVMPKRTEEGTRLYEHILGFKEYLGTAEKYRLQWQEKENIFETYLPYAMVFMVVDKWTNALRDVINQPDWYQSSHPGAWDVMYFNASMRDLNRSLNSAVMVAPKSASSGGSGIGGGFSGGGFGGGGGGSW